MSLKLIRPVVPIDKWLDSEYYLGKECYTLFPYWKEAIISYFNGDKRAFIFSGSSRCVPLDTMVAFSTGYQRIGDVISERSEGFTDSTGLSVFNGESIVPVSSIYFKKSDSVQHLHMTCGRVVSGTLDHPILAVKNGVKGFYNIGDLDIGDWVCFDDKPLDVGVDQYPVDQYYCLGHWLGDGCAVHHGKRKDGMGNGLISLDFLTSYKWVIEKISSTLGKNYKTDFTKCNVPMYFIRIWNVNDLSNTIFSRVHLGNAYTKEVPDCVFSASLKARVAFFRGILDSDGSFTYGGFNLDVASKKLRDGVACVMETLGIPYHLSEKIAHVPISSKNLDGSRTTRIYRLSSRLGKISQFDVLHLYEGYKQVSWSSDFTVHSLQRCSLVPLNAEEKYYLSHLPTRNRPRYLRGMKKRGSVYASKVYARDGLANYIRKSVSLGYVNRESILKLQEAYYWVPITLLEKCSSGYYYQIKSKSRTVEDVLDICVPDKHLFYAQGCINHNSGKSVAAAIIVIRFIYEISCIENFPGLFGLSATTLPKGIYFSFSNDAADSTGIKRILRIIDQIPYFNHATMRRRLVSTVISFPYVEVYGGSRYLHAIGSDLLFTIFDEANERGNVAKSSVVSDAVKIWMEIRMRSETTFSINGVWGGCAGIISTAGMSSSFVDMELEKAKKHGNYFYREAASYDVRPQSYSKERFLVYPGDGGVPAFITDDPGPEVIQSINALGISVEQFLSEKDSLIVHPPVSLRHFYEEDINTALQNLSGVTRLGSSLFISNKSYITRMFDSVLKYPTKLTLHDKIPHFGIYDELLPEELVDEDMINEVYNGERCYISMDLSRVNDPTGFSAIFFNEEQRKILPVLVTPIYLDRFKPGNEIDLVKIMGLITHLHRLGVNIHMVTADGYSSDYIIQRCKLLLGNDKVERFSVDKTPTGHITMLNFMKLGMYRLYPIQRLQYELENLIYDPVAGKVDHPVNSDATNPVYYKDLSDSLAASSFELSVYENLSYEDLMVTSEVEKARMLHKVDEEEEEDFYGDLVDGEDFYGDLSAVGDVEELDPLDQMMHDIMP